MDKKSLKILMISGDRNILTPNSQVSQRIKKYGDMVQELHIVLLSDRKHGLKETQITPNTWVYPTNSQNRFLRPFSASHLGKRIIYEKKFVRGESVITAQDPFECGWAALKVKNKWRIPLEVQIHTDPFSPYFRGGLNLIRRIIARRVLKGADGIRTVSNSVRDELIKGGYKSEIKVLPIFFDTKVLEEGRVTFDLHARFGWSFVILMVSRLTKEKNIDLAIKALKIVNAKFSRTGLVIVGSGPEEGHLKKLIQKLDLTKNTVFEGWQDNLVSYYKTANLFLQTSLYEGYGLSFVEASLAGLPTITTAVGIAKEFEHGKDIYCTDAKDENMLSEHIIDLIENNSKRDFMKNNAKSRILGMLMTEGEYYTEIKNNWEMISHIIKL